jgi:four helix bundle protein
LGIKGIDDLKVYNLAFELAMEIFKLTIIFPREERYSLTDQIRRSSRSAAINIREGFAKRKFEKWKNSVNGQLEITSP